VTLDVDFDLTFLNPCLDENFVTIDKVDLDELTYTVTSGVKTFTHPAYTTSTV